MKKKYYNYLIFFSLIFLVAFSFIKKNNFIIFTISPIGSHQLKNIEIVNSELERNFLIHHLNYIKRKINQFYIDDYTYNEINKIYPNIKIVNKKKYFRIIIKDDKKKVENIERIEILLNNFLLNQNTIEILKILEEKKNFSRIIFKYNRKEYEELIKEIIRYQKLNDGIKNKNIRFFTVLNEY